MNVWWPDKAGSMLTWEFVDRFVCSLIIGLLVCWLCSLWFLRNKSAFHEYSPGVQQSASVPYFTLVKVLGENPHSGDLHIMIPGHYLKYLHQIWWSDRCCVTASNCFMKYDCDVIQDFGVPDVCTVWVLSDCWCYAWLLPGINDDAAIKTEVTDCHPSAGHDRDKGRSDRPAEWVWNWRPRLDGK